MPDDSTPILDWPYPDTDGGDTADVPRDMKALALAIEAAVLDGAIWKPGDIKYSARAADHGRWLLLDGRELNQAQIEAALSIDAGSAAALVTLLGTGTSSIYGDAASGKVKLPDARDKFAIGSGTNHPRKGAGSSGGAETVTLTAAQSGLPGHGHTVTDSGHVHAITDPGHGHGASSGNATPVITVATGSTGITAVTDSRTPAITITDPGHGHTISGVGSGLWMRQTPLGSATVTAGGTFDKLVTPTIDSNTTGITAANASHSHTVAITDPAHTHTATQAAHNHSVTVSSSTTGITVNSHSTGLTVDSASSAPASDSHTNMPPFVSIGSGFIRV